MSASPRYRGTPTRSPLSLGPSPGARPKHSRRETCLELERIIGLTCNSPASFNTHAESRSFAYTAGAAAVVATVDQDFKITQQFYRCNALGLENRNPIVNPSLCLSPTTHVDQRSRLSVRGAREDSPTAHLRLSPNGKATGPSDRVKAAAAIALSPNAKWLAVGQSGYKPRVLLYARDSTVNNGRPVASTAEHSFGLHSVAFSPDSDMLATLGNVNDGFLRIWTVDGRTGSLTLLATNKCTNIVRQICWMGRNLVCVGVRFIKIWRPDEISPAATTNDTHTYYLPSPGVTHKPLIGRNTLLGDLLEATFTAVVPTSSSSAVVCTEAGSICILDDADKQQRLVRVLDAQFQITAAALTPDNRLIVAGGDDRIEVVSLPQNPTRALTPTPKSRPASPCKMPLSSETGVLAVACLAGAILALDHRRKLRVLALPSDDVPGSVTTPLLVLPSHDSPVLGVCSLTSSASRGSAGFVTWSADGSITGWSLDGQPAFRCEVPLDDAEDGEAGELKVVANLQNGRLLVTGDKYGIMSVMDTSTGRCIHKTRAHSAAITCISIDESEQDGTIHVASCSRDRTVQVFIWQDTKLDLLQTLCEHVGAVTAMAFTGAGSRLISCSADRTIVVRQRLDQQEQSSGCYEIIRTVTLKAAPASMRMSCHDNTVLVSTVDKMVHLVDLETGRERQTFKTSDQEGGDPVTLSALVHLPRTTGGPVVAGVSSSDKSIRLYSEDGLLLARDWGHTEGVTDIASLCLDTESDSHGLVTVAADGTIFVWKTTAMLDRKPGVRTPLTDMNALDTGSAGRESPLSRPPLRKVMSMSGVGRSYLRRRQQAEDSESDTPRSNGEVPPSPSRMRRPSRLDIATAHAGSRLKPRRSTVDLASSRYRTPSPCSPRSSATGSRPLMSRSKTALADATAVTPAHLARGDVLEDVRPTHESQDGQASPANVLATLRDYRSLVDSTAQKLSAGSDIPDKENAIKEVDESLRLKTRNDDRDKTALRDMEQELMRTLELVRTRLQGADIA